MRWAGQSTPTRTSDSTEPADETEVTGTVTVSTDGTSVTITAADGSTVSCVVPVGSDVSSFTGQVEAKCEVVDGVLTLTEIKAEDTPGTEPGDDQRWLRRRGRTDDGNPGDDDGDHGGGGGGDECTGTAGRR